jgi:hypothetical protein
VGDVVLLQPARTARGSIVAAFATVGVELDVLRRLKRVQRAVREDLRVVTVLREPVDRLQSYFNLRLRSGRPHHPLVWTDNEAAVFSVLRTFDMWGEAFVSDDPWLRSVAERAMSVFSADCGSLAELETLVQDSGSVVVGDVADLPAAVARLAALLECDVPALPDDPAVIDATPESMRTPVSELAMTGFRSRLGDELAAYDALTVAVG